LDFGLLEVVGMQYDCRCIHALVGADTSRAVGGAPSGNAGTSLGKLRLTVESTMGRPLLYFEARSAREVRQALAAMHSRVLRLWGMHSVTGICFCWDQRQRRGMSRQADPVG
jgi:hypothetical protein